MRTKKWKLLKTITVCAAVAILAVWFGIYYFSVKEFHLDGHTYRVAEDTGSFIRYVSDAGPPVVVRMDGTDRVVTIDGEDYRIRAEEQPYGIEYRVQYPNGKTYRVSGQHGLMAFDENGELVVGGGIYIEGERIPFGDENLRFHPSALVTAAFSQYHQTRGYPALYALSFVLFLFGWAAFRYESVQRAMFWLSLKWIWVEDPEPSEFYFFMCKIGGIIAMILSFVLFLQSLSRDFVVAGLL